MDPVKDIPAGKKVPEEVYVFIEVPRGCPIKYEYDKELGIMAVDRYLYSPVYYPGDYGMIPQTHCDDGDPLDALVLVSAPGYPGTLVRARPVGVLKMQDEKGMDDKLICVPVKDPRFAEVKDIADLPEHTVKEISKFFETYKALEPNKWVKVTGNGGADAAKKVLLDAIELYKKH